MTQTGPALSTGTGVSDIAAMGDGSVLAVHFQSNAASLRRLLANGEWDPDFAPELGEIRPTQSIVLDEANGWLYFSASSPSVNDASHRIPRIARLNLATQQVDSSWPATHEDPNVLAELSLRGNTVFAASRYGGWPIGAFLSTHTPPLFADGFEND